MMLREAKPIPESRKFHDAVARCRSLDRIAKEIAASEGIPLIEAYPRAVDRMCRWRADDREAQRL